ncbi:MAG: Lrp/AsnC family transcriptional regulator [Thermodesulfobacteriota bacterium]
MDDRDRHLLNEIQSAFPVEVRPYRALGKKLAMDEQEVMDRIAGLRREGIIRRLGASINSRLVGFVSTLCTAQVPEDRFDEFVRVVNSCPGVTHNYKRRHRNNVWFTLIAESQREKKRILEELIKSTGISILELPATRIFKIRVDFRF